MKTTLDLPDDLVRQMKIRAVNEGRPLKRLVAELLRHSLNAPTLSGHIGLMPESQQIVLNERGFPVINCGPHAPASRMSAKELVELEQKTLQEEDLERAGLPL